MINNYFKIAWRNLLKRKGYSLINILGLALGAAICLLIVLFIDSEKKVDAWRTDADNVYRMVLKREYPTRQTSYAIIPQSYAKTLKEELPEVEESSRIFNFYNNGTYQLRYENQKFEETDVYVVDPSFFNVFKTEFLYGTKEKALKDINATVLTESTAIKYFGSAQKAVGKLLQPEGADSAPLKVTAVCKDWPVESHFTFNMLLSTAGKSNFEDVNFVNFSAYTYLKLIPEADPSTIESIFPEIVRKFAAPNIEKSFAMSFDDFLSSGNGYVYSLQHIKDIYLTSNLESEFRANGNATTLYIFGVVAIFILVIAGVNFINLSTARASERAREVGIRKTFGSQKKSLIFQFLTESLLVSLFSMGVAVNLFFLMLPLFNTISEKDFSWNSLLEAKAIALLFTFSIIIGVLAGVYPAFVLSSYKPMSVLRGSFKSGNKGRALRSSLVVFQFSISIVLIICTLVVNRQMNFMTSDTLGFTMDQTLIIERTDLLGANTKAFKNEVSALKNVTGITGSTALPGQSNYYGISWATPETRNEPITGRGILVDEGYGETLGLTMLEGRFFSEAFVSDSLAVVLNETAVNELGLSNPVGKYIFSPDAWMNAQDGTTMKYKVIGVVKDFHFQSLHEPISPLIFTSARKFNNIMGTTAVHLEGDAVATSIASIENIWSQFVEDKPFTYTFLDSTVEEQYLSEATARKVFTFFSGITIFIACLGLLGLAAYTTRQRIQEIGVRKILGAKISNIVALLSKDFLKLVLLSTLIALPIAWYAMHRWLEGFTYRIESSWDLFVIAGIIALCTAFATISVQALKAAMLNPVKSLRTE